MRRRLRTWQYLTLQSGVFLIAASFYSFAQKTVVNDAGPGLKQEFDYDAAGHVVQARTITTSGKLQVKVDYSYNSRGDTEKQTSTHYWPDGKSVQKIAQSTYDENSNFTTEIVEDFDLTGKHVSGHELYHDPMTGTYRCLDWKAAPQKYQVIDCPASEESKEVPGEVRKITRDEVMQDLAAARQAAQAWQKSQRVKPKNMVEASASTPQKQVAILLPAQLRAGARVSGSVVDDPDRCAGNPDLLVTRVSLPEKDGVNTQLGGWTIEIGGAAPQPSDGPISFVVPTGGTLAYTLRRSDDPFVAVSGKIEVPKPATPKASSRTGFESSALCFTQGTCTVAGTFTGDSRKTFAAFDKIPAPIIAETTTAAYVKVPNTVPGGSATLIIAEGKKVAAMVMVVASVSLEPKSGAIQTGHNEAGVLHVENVGELADAQWRYGVFPASTLDEARKLVPGFSPQKVVHDERERREKQEKQNGVTKKKDKQEESAGMLLVLVSNATPDIASLRGATHGSYIFRLVPDSFSMGEFKFSFAVEGLKMGTYALRVTAVPFLAPVKAQLFDAAAASN